MTRLKNNETLHINLVQILHYKPRAGSNEYLHYTYSDCRNLVQVAMSTYITLVVTV